MRVDALENEELVHEATAIVGCQTPSVLRAHRTRMNVLVRGQGGEARTTIMRVVGQAGSRSKSACKYQF
jgi:hypothetical protein